VAKWKPAKEKPTGEKPIRRRVEEIPLGAATVLIYQPSVKIWLDDGASFAGMLTQLAKMRANARFRSFRIDHSRLMLNS
jgi:hypothetical protein